MRGVGSNGYSSSNTVTPIAPAHFDVSVHADPADPAQGRLVTVRRGGWAQSYYDRQGQWVRQFEADLTCRFFR